LVEMPRHGQWCAMNLDLSSEDSWSGEVGEGGS
jgi:hypothetical protein